MGVAGAPPAAITSDMRGSAALRLFDLSAIPPRLVAQMTPSAGGPRRTRIWEFNTNLHCSIIGTCLSNADLRQMLKKFGLASQDCTDHELHGIAVTLAGRNDDAARLLHKALDRRHKLAVSQFCRADTEDALRTLWHEFMRRGDIPGAYWATLTHPLATQAMIREAFGEVHMLSHLVGSANRADIRRLCVLEAEKIALEGKVERQQLALHQAVVTRDRQIAELRQALGQRIVSGAQEPPAQGEAGLRALVVNLEHRLEIEARRRNAVEGRLATALAELARERAARVRADRDARAIRGELDLMEQSFATGITSGPSAQPPKVQLDGVVLLYVGGRPNQVAPMRAVAERLGATLLHHDGGVEHHGSLLAGMASRADIMLFPVDCISHEAATMVKALCRQSGKRFVRLRSASVTSLLAALQSSGVVKLFDAAD
jgi:uncharacterized protein DUF2325